MRKFPAGFAAALALSSICVAQTAIRRHPAARNARPVMAARAPKPDLILINGIIYTGAGFDEDKPQVVQAMAIGGGKVLAVGKNEEVTTSRRPQHPITRS